jgi:hypothetical protein
MANVEKEWSVEPPDKFSETDFVKLSIDYLKHITTLASGSLVLLATFLDKFPHPKIRWIVGWIIVALAISIGLSCGSMLLLMRYGRSVEFRSLKDRKELTRWMTLSVLSFVTAMLGLVVRQVLITG